MLSFVFLWSLFIIWGIAYIRGYRVPLTITLLLLRYRISPEKLKKIDAHALCRLHGYFVIVVGTIMLAFMMSLEWGLSGVSFILAIAMILSFLVYGTYFEKFVVRGNHFRINEEYPTTNEAHVEQVH